MSRAATVTGLRRVRPGKVAVYVDGRRWRLLSDEAVLDLGLKAGDALDRSTIRRLRDRIRREEALRAATGALAHRDLSRSALSERLSRAGIAPVHRRAALSTLERGGLLDDDQTARRRAVRLAETGWGDAAIEERLASEGIGEEAVHKALCGLEPEHRRISEFVPDHDDKRRSAAYLSRRGFRWEAIESVLGLVDDEPPIGLR